MNDEAKIAGITPSGRRDLPWKVEIDAGHRLSTYLTRGTRPEVTARAERVCARLNKAREWVIHISVPKGL